MDNAGIVLDVDDNDAPTRPNDELPPMSATLFKDNYNHLTTPELEDLLKEALGDEDYDKAALLRDEITKRKMS